MALVRPAALVTALVVSCVARPSSLRPPHDLLVESLATPEGVDAPVPRYSWSLAPATAGARLLSQSAYELRLSLSPSADAPPLWTSGPVLSNATSLVAPPGAPALPASSRIFWAVRAWGAAGEDATAFAATAVFTTGLSAWDGEWVSGPRGENLFRFSFSLAGIAAADVASALAHVAGLGAHEVSFNGGPAGGNALRKLDGGWTRYTTRVLYTTHDLTAALAVPFENVLGVGLGNSWFGDRGWYRQPPYGWPSAMNGGGFSYDVAPLLRVQIVVRLLNGSQIRLSTSGGMGELGWLAAAGPVTFDSLYDGETFSGPRAAALSGWDALGFVPFSSDWRPVVSASPNVSVNPALNAKLTAQSFEPTMRLTDAPPLTMWAAEPGVTIYDFGMNGVGNVRWTFRGLPAGTNATMRYAEVLVHPPYGPSNNSLYFDNLRNAHATDYYEADGSEGVEVYEPRWTWHGFRYAQVSGLPAPPALNDVAVVRQANGVAPGASYSFSAPLLGQIEAMAINTIASNLQQGPGSCGQRDERQFFTGDTQVSALASMQHFRLRALMSSWILNGLDEQNPDGSIGYYLPTPITDARDGSPQWSTGFLTVTWLLMELEGDIAGCRAVYGTVKRYVAFNEGQYAAAITQCGNLSCYWPAWPSEWQQIGPDPDPSAMNAFAYVHDLQMAGDVADGLGEGADAAAFRLRAAQRTAEYHAAFFRPATSTYGLGTQSELSVALLLGAPPTPEVAAAVFANLVATAQKQLVGIVGGKFFYDVLASYGRADVATRILLDDTEPSFGWMAAGADNPEPSSTIWELWEAYKGNPIMSSRNHVMLASYSSFLLRLAVGVAPLGPGFADGALVWPLGLGLLNNTQALLPFASGTMTTPRGTVEVAWSTLAPAPPAGPATCGEATEADEPAMAYVSPDCGPRANISRVDFASFGHPTGACVGGPPFAADPDCEAPTSRALVEAACLGRRNCSVAVDFHAFGNTCAGKKWLAINVSCAGAPPPPPPSSLVFLGSLSVTVPVNLPATVRFNSFGLASPVGLVLFESQGVAPLWVEGAFQGGMPGVLGASVSPALGPAGAFFVDVAVGSGAFVFTVWANATSLGSVARGPVSVDSELVSVQAP